ncbi:SLOG family protein [Oscillibacter sp.]|uniref:SLOG family protein n=1 Tax=Oscillibacter sp. TaxID=1945593 RepID=UPI00260455A9|nr:SLOG family protein [Oscillibacter sp.]MDD3346974.1 SLOG family protein [Oscillibacter sp.]
MRARQETCCFTGHRPGKLPWRFDETDQRCLLLKRRMQDAVEAAYQEGYRHFLCGMALGCDLYFCECVMALRERHPDVTVEAAVPCPTQADGWTAAQRARYQHLVEGCDLETLVSAKYTPTCMQRRDRYMVDHASLLIAAFDGTAGGTQYTMQYAMQRGLDIVDLPIPSGNE